MTAAPMPSRARHSNGAIEMASTEFLLYQSEDGLARIEVRMVGDDVWLSLTQLTELFGRDKSVISRHIKNIYDEGEVPRNATVAVFATVQAEGSWRLGDLVESRCENDRGNEPLLPITGRRPR